jgi:hypothetical protein
MASSELAKQISEVTKGKISLSEAIRELELSKEAFSHIHEISTQIKNHENLLTEMRSRFEHLVSVNYFNARIDEVSHVLDKSVKNRVDELSVSVLSQLNNKITSEDAESLFNKRVPWSSFNSLSQEVGMMKTRMEKHILSEFEGFKTKLKIELSNVLKPKKTQEPAVVEEVLQLKTKVAGIEQQLQQLFNEEMLDEDYDSQEELDGMMDDLERAVLKDKKSIEIQDDSSNDASDMKDSIETKDKSKNENSETETRVERSGSTERHEKHEKHEKQEKQEKIEEIEVRIPTVMKAEDSPKNITSSRADSRSYMRKNSKTSSAASRMMGSAAIRNLTKKLETVKKEIDDNQQDFLLFKESTSRFDDEIGDIRENINLIEQKLKDFASQIEVMQASFLRALRRSGVTKEKPQIVEKKEKKVEKSQEIQKVFKEIDEKFKRMVRVELEITKVSNDFGLIKKFIREQVKEMSESHLKFVETVSLLQKEVKDLKKLEENNEKCMKIRFQEVRSEIKEVRGPLCSLVSDQTRESSTLVEEIRRNQEMVRVLIEDFNVRPPSQKSVLKSAEGYRDCIERKSHSRVSSATPTLTSKHRYYRSNKTSDVQNIEENWLSCLPDGKPVCLPRVSYTVQKTERSSFTPEVDTRR